mgnify:CR=1 FL=1
MPTNRFRHLSAVSLTQVAQVKTFTITATGGGTAVWTLTLTDEKSVTHTVSYTEDGSPSVTEVATGLYTNWLASTDPYISRLTPTNPSAGVLVLTAKDAGRPFSVALADNGTGTHTEADTASVGFNDYGLASNWTGGELPDLYDDVVFEAGQTGVLYGMNQSAVPIAGFSVEPGCESQIGRYEFGEYTYLRIAPTSFNYRGSGRLCLFDIGSAAISPYIEAYGQPGTQGLPAIFIKGSAISTLEVNRGAVGVAYLPGDTATVTTLTVGSENQQGIAQNALVLYLGSGLTLTTLNLSSGTCYMDCGATTVNVSNGATLITRAGAITTLNNRGTVYLNSSGTVTTLNNWGFVDSSRDKTARTISTYVEKPGGSLRYHSAVTLSAVTKLTDDGSHTYARVT